MAAHISGRGSSLSLIARLAQSARRVVCWRPGRYEVADEPESATPPEFVPAEPEPEPGHHSRYSPQELDECIEDSIRTGNADLYAALHDSGSGDFDPGKSRWGLRRSKRKPTQPPAAPREAKAFGGDLYPTAAHTTGGDVHYVKVSTWSSNQKPQASGEPPRS